MGVAVFSLDTILRSEMKVYLEVFPLPTSHVSSSNGATFYLSVVPDSSAVLG